MKKFIILLGSFVAIGLIPALRYLDDSMLFTSALAVGVGRTLLVGAIACVGLLYKPNKTLGFGVVAALSTGLLIVASFAIKKEKNDFNEKSVTAEIKLSPSDCSEDFPLQVSLTNVADKDSLSVGFSVIVSDAGHSTTYHSVSGSGMATDRIIAPGQVYSSCYRIPAFYTAYPNMTLAEGIPYTLTSPHYEIEVTGARMRGDD